MRDPHSRKKFFHFFTPDYHDDCPMRTSRINRRSTWAYSSSIFATMLRKDCNVKVCEVTGYDGQLDDEGTAGAGNEGIAIHLKATQNDTEDECRNHGA